jgi:beta-lactamase class A
MVSLLRIFHEGRALSPASSLYLSQLMAQTQSGPNRIRGMLPAGTVVPHKTGTSNTIAGITAATNDVGLISLPDGKTLAIAVFVSDSPAETAVREAVIAKLARAAWDQAVSGKVVAH